MKMTIFVLFLLRALSQFRITFSTLGTAYSDFQVNIEFFKHFIHFFMILHASLLYSSTV